MGLQSNLQVKESLSELKKFQKQQRNIKSEKRILCLILLKQKKFKTQSELADYLGVCRQTLVGWLTKYRKSGVSSIVIKPTRNKKSKIITPEIHQGLKKKLENSNNPLRGYWDAQSWVFAEFGVEVQYHWLRQYLIKHFNTKLKTPRKSHYKKEEQAIDTFLKTS